MRLIYLETFNQLEMEGQSNPLEAQLMISEEESGWQLMWTVVDDGQSEQIEVWYEGQCWDTLQQNMSDQLFHKLEEGYAPTYSLHQLIEFSEATEKSEILHYYSEEQYDEALYERLREWRKQEALKRNIPLYVIATNAMLKQISTFIPYTAEELYGITGLGSQRIQEYGTALLEITKEVNRTTEFPLDWVRKQYDKQGYKRWKLMNELSKNKARGSASHLRKKLLDLLSANIGLPDISNRLSLSTYRVLRTIEQCIDQGEVQTVDAWIQAEISNMPSEQYKVICEAYEKCGTSYLKPIMEEVKGVIDLKLDEDQIYDRLHIVRLEKKLKSLLVSENEAKNL